MCSPANLSSSSPRRSVTGTLMTLCLLVIAAFVSIPTTRAGDVPRPRGVELSRAALYEPTGNANDAFICLDGLKTIKYEQINDDYCDCADASDEPGTAACPLGHFHCANAGHRSLRLPSSRVNDGICDCCDASDEYASAAACANDCSERGQEDRVRDKQRAELARLGSQLKADMATLGRTRKAEQSSRLVELQRSHAEAAALVSERDTIRQDAERLESDALEVYRLAVEEDRRERLAAEAAQSSREAEEAFQLLDSNADGVVSVSELQVRATFDRNRDGEVSDEEAMYFLGELEHVDVETFVTVAWPQVKPFLMLEAGQFRQPLDAHAAEQIPTDEPHYDEDETTDAEKDAVHIDRADQEGYEAQLDQDHTGATAAGTDDEEEEYEDDEEETGEGAVEAVHSTEPAVEYDADTQLLIEQANGARSLHQEAERELRLIDAEIASIEQQLDKDYGTEEEYAALHGECFSYEDREYVYKVCPFDRAVQQSRGGGAETRLGSWDRWAGPAVNPYATMLFTNGVQCWNGPQRSATVHLECGLETKLLSVTEPNRCEYVCTMQTPAACSVKDGSAAGQTAADTHDEL